MIDWFLDRSGVVSVYNAESWQRVLFAELEAQMTSDARPFPCVYGVAGFKHDNLRFCFLDEIGQQTLGPVLEKYLSQARSNGRNASLVVFERPAPVQHLEDYRDRFWGLLDGLASRDKAPWPTDIPQEMNDPEWEFCYANEPIFVVCNTPAHVQRQSRRSTGFMVTLQPRWVFDGITDTENKAATAFGNVRQRLRTFDPAFPR